MVGCCAENALEQAEEGMHKSAESPRINCDKTESAEKPKHDPLESSRIAGCSLPDGSSEEGVEGIISREAASAVSLESIADATCHICLEPFEVGEHVTLSNVSSCQHAFHRSCIVEWLLRHDDCPCCRANFLEGVREKD